MKLDNISVSKKLFIAPGFLLLVLLGFAAATWVIFNAKHDRVATLKTEAIDQAGQTAQLVGTVELVHGAMFRIITWDSNGINFEEVDRLKEMIEQTKGSLTATGRIGELLDAYRAGLDTFLEESAMDVYAGLDAISALEPVYGELQALLAGERARVQANGQSAYDDVVALMERSTLLYGLAMAAAVLISVAVTLSVTRSLNEPLKRTARNIDRIARGDFSSTFRDATRGDEIGTMVSQLQILQATAQEAEQLRNDDKARAEREAHHAAALEAATRTFDIKVHETLDQFGCVMNDLKQTASRMMTAAGSVSDESGRLASGADSVSGHVESVSVSLGGLVDAVREISGQVQQASAISGRARDTGDRSSAELDSLAEAADRIGDVVTLISDIAGQTNLLALNATIEAARAGDAGKGFAVVASEVKNLANQTAKATEDISSQISGIQETTRTAVDAIGAMRDAIGEVDNVTTAIAAAIEEQDATTRDISEHVHAATGEVTGVAGSSRTLQGEAETGRGVATDLMRANEVLDREAGSLKKSIEAFLRDVATERAA